MVKPGGRSTMLGHWRIVLRQAEESARVGRLEDALALASRADVADHRQAVQLRGRLTRELVGRAIRRAEADDLAGAVEDLKLAERYGAAPDELAQARLKLAEQVADEIQGDLEAGDPVRVLERVDRLARDQISDPNLRRYRDAAASWREALTELRAGEFSQARELLERADRQAAGVANEALESARRDLEERQQTAAPKIERLYQALGESKNWGEVLAAAESLLETLPDHPAAQQARAQAWKRIGGLAESVSLPSRHGSQPRPIPERVHEEIRFSEEIHQKSPSPKTEGIIFLDEPTLADPSSPRAPATSSPAHARASGPTDRFLLWADTVGGFLICRDREVILGRAGADSRADVPILSDLSRNHARIVRQGDGYVIHAHHPTFVNGRKVVGRSPLRDRDVIRLGATVELLFRQPSPISATARLEIVSRHRFPLAVEGVILLAETCIIGSSTQSHIISTRLKEPVVLFRQGDQIGCRMAGAFTVDDQERLSRAPLTLQSRVQSPDLSFSLEPLDPRAVTS